MMVQNLKAEIAKFRAVVASIEAAEIMKLTMSERTQLVFEARWCIEALQQLQARLHAQDASA